MSLSQGCLNVQLLLQKFLITPILIDPANPTLAQARETWGKSRKWSRGRLLWLFFSHCAFPSMTCFALWRVHWLLSTWKIEKRPEQLGFYIFALALSSIAVSLYRTFDLHSDELCFAITQRFKLSKLVPLGWPSRERMPELPELFVYDIAFNLLIVYPALYCALPFLRDYDPFQLAILRILKTLSLGEIAMSYYVILLLIKICSCLGTGILAVHGVAVFVYLTMLILSFLEALIKRSFDLYNRSPPPPNQGGRRKKQLNKPQPSTAKVRRGEPEPEPSVQIQLNFSRTLRLYRVLQILTRTGSQICSESLAVLAGMGILATTMAGYTMLLLYNELPLLLYIPFSTVCLLGYMFNFLLTTLAGIPHENGERFRKYWKFHVRAKRDKLELSSCPPIGFSFGPVRIATRGTGLTMCDIMLNALATLCLLKR